MTDKPDFIRSPYPIANAVERIVGTTNDRTHDPEFIAAMSAVVFSHLYHRTIKGNENDKDQSTIPDEFAPLWNRLRELNIYPQAVSAYPTVDLRDLKLSPNGQRLVNRYPFPTGTKVSGIYTIISARKLKPMFIILNEYDGPDTKYCFSKNSEYFAILSSNSLQIWNVYDIKKVYSEDVEGTPTAISWSGDSGSLAYSVGDTVRIVYVEDGISYDLGCQVHGKCSHIVLDEVAENMLIFDEAAPFILNLKTRQVKSVDVPTGEIYRADWTTEGFRAMLYDQIVTIDPDSGETTVNHLEKNVSMMPSVKFLESTAEMRVVDGMPPQIDEQGISFFIHGALGITKITVHRDLSPSYEPVPNPTYTMDRDPFPRPTARGPRSNIADAPVTKEFDGRSYVFTEDCISIQDALTGDYVELLGHDILTASDLKAWNVKWIQQTNNVTMVVTNVYGTEAYVLKDGKLDRILRTDAIVDVRLLEDKVLFPTKQGINVTDLTGRQVKLIHCYDQDLWTYAGIDEMGTISVVRRCDDDLSPVFMDLRLEVGRLKAPGYTLEVFEGVRLPVEYYNVGQERYCLHNTEMYTISMTDHPYRPYSLSYYKVSRNELKLKESLVPDSSLLHTEVTPLTGRRYAVMVEGNLDDKRMNESRSMIKLMDAATGNQVRKNHKGSEGQMYTDSNQIVISGSCHAVEDYVVAECDSYGCRTLVSWNTVSGMKYDSDISGKIIESDERSILVRIDGAAPRTVRISPDLSKVEEVELAVEQKDLNPYRKEGGYNQTITLADGRTLLIPLNRIFTICKPEESTPVIEPIEEPSIIGTEKKFVVRKCRLHTLRNGILHNPVETEFSVALTEYHKDPDYAWTWAVQGYCLYVMNGKYIVLRPQENKDSDGELGIIGKIKTVGSETWIRDLLVHWDDAMNHDPVCILDNDFCFIRLDEKLQMHNMSAMTGRSVKIDNIGLPTPLFTDGNISIVRSDNLVIVSDGTRSAKIEGLGNCSFRLMSVHDGNYRFALEFGGSTSQLIIPADIVSWHIEPAHYMIRQYELGEFTLMDICGLFIAFKK